MASSFWLRALPPFRLDLTAWAVRRRSENKVDLWDGTTYSRVLPIGGRAAKICVTQGPISTSRLGVMVAGVNLGSSTKAEVLSSLDRLLGRRIDLNPFYAFAGQDARRHRLSERF
jgi:DNA-3-methyladenine glycosylase II